MKYVYAYVAPFSDGLIEVEILDEVEVFDRLYNKLDVINEFNSLDELVSFIDEWQLLNLENGEVITITTLSGDVILQIG